MVFTPAASHAPSRYYPGLTYVRIFHAGVIRRVSARSPAIPTQLYKKELLMFRQFAFAWTVLLISISAGHPLAGHGQDSIWLEGEQPTTKNVEVKAVGLGRTELLSGGKWLLLQIEQQDVAKKLPKEGARLGYQFQVATAGKYEVWSRIGWEGIRSPFDWRIDQGPWHTVKPDYPTTDHVELAFWCPLGWMKLGETDLAAGKHTLEFRVSAWSKQENGKDVAQGIMFACDATCLIARSLPTQRQAPARRGLARQQRQAGGPAGLQVCRQPRGCGGATRTSAGRPVASRTVRRAGSGGPDRADPRCRTPGRSSGWGPTCPTTNSRTAPNCRFATG